MTPLLNIPQRMYKESDDHWEEQKIIIIKLQYKIQEAKEKRKIILEKGPQILFTVVSWSFKTYFEWRKKLTMSKLWLGDLVEGV